MSEQILIRTVDEGLCRVALAERRKANRDRASSWTLRESLGYVRKASVSISNAHIWQCTDKLVATEAHDQVVGAQTRLQRISNGDQQAISGEVAHGVVDCLKTVDVTKRDDQLLGDSACPIYLSLKLCQAGTSPPDVSQFIGLRRLAVLRRLDTFARRLLAVVNRLRTFLGCPQTIVCRAGAIVCGALTKLGRPIVR